MSLETITSNLTNGEYLGRFISPELTDSEYIEQGSATIRREAEVLLRMHGIQRRYSFIAKAAVFLIDSTILVMAPPILHLENGTRLNTAVKRNGQKEVTINIEADTLKDPMEASEIKVDVSGLRERLVLPKVGLGHFALPDRLGVELESSSLTRTDIDNYNNLLTIVRACKFPTPRTQDLICVDKTYRSSIIPIFDSRPALQR